MREQDIDTYYILCHNQQNWMAVKSTFFGCKFARRSNEPTKFESVQQAIEYAVKHKIFSKVEVFEVKEVRDYEHMGIPR